MQADSDKPTQAYHGNIISTLVWCVLLIVLGVLGNRFSLSLAFGVDFIFGSVSAFLALRLFGFRYAFVVAFFVAAYTYLMWGHPYAWLNFTLEMTIVAALLRSKRINNMVVADSLYWLVVGVPIVLLSYILLLSIPEDQVLMIALKQSLNGITNSILASLILMVLPVEWLNRISTTKLIPKFGIREMSFVLIIAIVYFSAIVMIFMQGRNIYKSMREQIEISLSDNADDIRNYIAIIGEDYDPNRVLNIFSAHDEIEPHGIILLSSTGQVIASNMSKNMTGFLVSHDMENGGPETMRTWHPEAGAMPLMIWWNKSFYYVSQSININGIGKVIISIPAAGLINKLHFINMQSLELLSLVLIVAMLFALIISRAMSHTILRLVDITEDLPNKLRNGVKVEWPTSRVLELDSLSQHSNLMSQNIFSTFKGYESSQEILNEQVRNTANALDENYARSSAIIAGSAEGIITIDEYGQIESFNAASEEMFGYEAKDIIGKNIKCLMPEPFSGQHDNYLENYRNSINTGNKLLMRRRELLAKDADGNEFPVEISVSEISLKNRRVFTGFITDISERKETERLKNEFISTVSHELRTPLTAIRGAIGLLSAKESNGLSEKSKGLLNITLNNTQRLVRLINDILDIQKLESGGMKFTLTEERLLPIIYTVIEQNNSYVEQFEASLRANLPRRDYIIMTNPDRLNQVLTNLISNAAKFSPAGGEIGLQVKEEGNDVVIEVADQGGGIPEEFHSRIFEKFSQADGSSTRRQNGTGLGLSISKGFVEKMGGSIDFRTSLKQGTVFFVRFPIVRQATLPGRT